MSDFPIPPDRDFPHGHRERRARHLVRELSATRRRRRLVLTLVPAVVVLLTAATGFTAYSLLRTEPTHLQSIGCYDRADLAANVAIVNSTASGPLELCRELWAKGDMGSPAPAHLAACVLQTGPVGVFPSTDDQTCERLGLADVSAEGLRESKRFAALHVAIVHQLGEPASGSSRGSKLCIGEAAARRIVRHELDTRGYSEWTIEIGADGFTTDRPCAEIDFAGDRKAAIIIPVWRR